MYFALKRGGQQRSYVNTDVTARPVYDKFDCGMFENFAAPGRFIVMWIMDGIYTRDVVLRCVSRPDRTASQNFCPLAHPRD